MLSVQGLRALLYGFGAVLLGTVLAREGLSALEAGAVFTAMLAGMAIGSLVIGRWGDAIGRRRAYLVLFAILGVAGSVFAVTSWLPLLLIAALTGTISTDANESGPITTIEQAILSGIDPATRTRAFGRYNAVAYAGGSIGALAAGGPALLRQVVPSLPADQRFLFAFPVFAALCILLAVRLPADAERAHRTRGPRLGPSRRTVRRLAALFAVDSFAGGLVVQSFIVFWFERRFGASVELMATVFFGVGVLQALSSLMATRVAHRIGLLYTMVFTHIPSNLLLAAVPLVPSLPLAVTMLLLRSALSQMDVPSRQAYIASLVEPSERTAAAAYTNSARYATRPFGPLVGGSLMQATALSAPFLAAGGIKTLYDLVLLALFRGVREAGDAPHRT